MTKKTKISLMTALMLFCLAMIVSCGAVRFIGRTMNDIASDLCMVVASEQQSQDLNGLSPREWCSIHENLKPFIDLVFAAKADAARQSGFKRYNQ